MSETTPGLGGLLYAMSDEHARRLRDRDEVLEAMLVRDWRGVEQRALADLAALQETMDAARAAGKPVNQAWLYRQARLQAVLGNVAEQVEAYGGRAADLTEQGQAWAHRQGQADAVALTGQAAGLSADMVRTVPANVATAAGFLADGSPLVDLFKGMGVDAATTARAVLTQAVALGWGADRTAREFRDGLALAQHRATTIARTELHRVYRTTTRDTYQANADVVTGWTWRAHLDSRTCTGCMAMDGTVHPVDEVLDGHPRCRCAMVPLTPSWADLGITGVDDLPSPVQRRGDDLLRSMSPADLRRALGPSRAALYRAGQIDLQDMVVRTHDPRWGSMRREATVAEARANAAARGVQQRVSRTTPAAGTRPARRKSPAEVRTEAAALDAKAAAARRAADEHRRREVPEAAWARKDRLALADARADAASVQRRMDEARQYGWADVEATYAATLESIQWRVNSLERALAGVGERPRLGWELGLPRKAAPVSAVDDLRAVNPRYDEGPEWQANCTRASATWELRQRGYDVTAGPARTGESDGRIQGNWRDPETGLERPMTHPPTGADVLAEVARWPVGARGMVTTTWRSGGGHVWNVVRDADGPRFVEAQQVLVRTNGQVVDYASDYTQQGRDGTWGLLRVDDLVPTTDLEGWVQPVR